MERFVAAGGGGKTVFRWLNPANYLWEWAAGSGIDPDTEIHTVVWGDTGGNGRFVAAGSGGSVYIATDGEGSQIWRRVEADGLGDAVVRASAFGNGVFVIGGDGGRMAWSADGVDWNDVAVDESGDSAFGTSDVLTMAFGSGVFVAAGSDGKMALSVNGVDWEVVSDGGFGPGERINGVATDGLGRFVAVGNRDSDNAGRIVSWYQKPPSDRSAPGLGFKER